MAHVNIIRGYMLTAEMLTFAPLNTLKSIHFFKNVYSCSMTKEIVNHYKQDIKTYIPAYCSNSLRQ